MPLKPGKVNIGDNIKEELAAGKPQAQAEAIALDVARRTGGDVPGPPGIGVKKGPPKQIGVKK